MRPHAATTNAWRAHARWPDTPKVRHDMLKYTNHDIVFQEFPDEVTLAINLSLCPKIGRAHV